jgi:hypothetical protein
MSHINSSIRVFVFAISLLLLQITCGAAELTPHSAVYKIKISVLGGELRTHLQKLENGYRAESSIEATGMSRLIAHGAIRESSVFYLSDEGLRPAEFNSDDTLSKGGETVDFRFDWDANEITGTIDGAEFQTPLEGIVHDRVSLQFGLMHDLINGIHRDAYKLQDAETLKPLAITNIGAKRVKVPFGQFDVIGIQHQSEGSSRKTTLWVAESLGYLPVIIEQHRNGKLQVRAMLTEYTPEP